MLPLLFVRHGLVLRCQQVPDVLEFQRCASGLHTEEVGRLGLSLHEECLELLAGPLEGPDVLNGVG
jgi:hypothetical protein